MLRQMRESTLRQTRHVRVASDTRFSLLILLDKMRLCAMTLPTFPHLVGQNVISDGPKTDCRYCNGNITERLKRDLDRLDQVNSLREKQ